MEPKYIIQQPVTFELYKEWVKNPIASNVIEKRKKRIRMNIAGCCLGVFVIALGALSGKIYTMLIGASCVVVFLYSLFIEPNRRIKRSYDSALKALNKNQWIITIAFADKIVVDDGRNQTHFEYSELSKVTEDDNYFYLFFYADIAIRLPKDSFNSGSPGDFKTFINYTKINKAKHIATAEDIKMEQDDLGL